jgi:hypothetical protein
LEKIKHDIPLWMLFIRLPTVTYWLRSKLNEAIIEFAMRPVVSSRRRQNIKV